MQEGTGNKTRMSHTAVFRVGVLLTCILIIFITIRQLALPVSFGQFGYYRGNNVQEWVLLQPNFAAGNQACRNCHSLEVQAMEQAEHAQLDCQSCHGPLTKHVSKPKESHPKVPGNAELCGACHRALVGRQNEQIATVRVGEHSGGLDCTRCHNPHQPGRK